MSAESKTVDDVIASEDGDYYALAKFAKAMEKGLSAANARIADLERNIRTDSSAVISALEAECAALKHEIQVLRQWGNSDCTRMADAVLDAATDAAMVKSPPLGCYKCDQ